MLCFPDAYCTYFNTANLVVGKAKPFRYFCHVRFVSGLYPIREIPLCYFHRNAVGRGDLSQKRFSPLTSFYCDNSESPLRGRDKSQQDQYRRWISPAGDTVSNIIRTEALTYPHFIHTKIKFWLYIHATGFIHLLFH